MMQQYCETNLANGLQNKRNSAKPAPVTGLQKPVVNLKTSSVQVVLSKNSSSEPIYDISIPSDNKSLIGGQKPAIRNNFGSKTHSQLDVSEHNISNSQVPTIESSIKGSNFNSQVALAQVKSRQQKRVQTAHSKYSPGFTSASFEQT